MKKIIFSIFSLCLLTVSNAQQDYGNYDVYSDYQMDNINPNGFQDLRLRTAGTKAFQLMVFVPFEMNSDGIEVDSTIELNNQHRLTEYLIPSFKYYLDDRSDINFGLFYRSIAEKKIGDVDTSLAIVPLLLKNDQRKTGRGMYLRTAYNRHFATQRFKKFDVDPYFGAALTLGFIPQKEVDNEDYVGGNYSYTTKKSKAFGMGVDAYGGVNLQFERFSLGAELLVFGFDYNRNFGKSKVLQETKIGNTVTTNEYYELDGDANKYSSLKYSKKQSTMYRGLRLVFCYYLR